MKYCINIDKKIIQSLLNSSIEINVMLYHIALKLKLMIQDILESSLSVHKMMFQNLFLKLHKNIDDDEVVQISSTVIDNDEEGSGLSIL